MMVARPPEICASKDRGRYRREFVGHPGSWVAVPFWGASLPSRSVLDRWKLRPNRTSMEITIQCSASLQALAGLGSKKCAWAVSDESFTASPLGFASAASAPRRFQSGPVCATTCVSEPVGSMRETRQGRPASGRRIAYGARVVANGYREPVRIIVTARGASHRSLARSLPLPFHLARARGRATCHTARASAALAGNFAFAERDLTIPAKTISTILVACRSVSWPEPTRMQYQLAPARTS